MQITVQSVADLGLALRAARKGARVLLDDLAGIAGVSKQFASDAEYGKQMVQLARKFLAEMGLHLTSDLPPAVEPSLQARGGVGKRQASKDGLRTTQHLIVPEMLASVAS